MPSNPCLTAISYAERPFAGTVMTEEHVTPLSSMVDVTCMVKGPSQSSAAHERLTSLSTSHVSMVNMPSSPPFSTRQKW